MKEQSISEIDKKIIKIKKKLGDLGDIRPGSLTKQYNICGKEGCRCKNKINPIKHGPYYNLSYTYKGRGTSAYIPELYVHELKIKIDNYSKMKKLIDEWIELSILKSKIEIKLIKKNNKK